MGDLRNCDCGHEGDCAAVLDHEEATGRMMQVMVERRLGFPAWSREDYFALIATVAEGVLPATEEYKTIGAQQSDDENQDGIDAYRLVSEWIPVLTYPLIS